MKHVIYLSFLFGLSFSNFAQVEMKTILEIKKSISTEVRDGDSDQSFDMFDFGLGARLNHRWGSVEMKGIYKASRSSFHFGRALQSHFLGGGLKLVLLNKEKRFRAFVEFNLFSEIATNYKDGYLALYRFNPTEKPADPNYYGLYSSNFYDSTPIIGSLLVGVDIKLSKNLNIGIAIGYGKREMLYRERGWYGSNEDEVISSLEEYPTSLKRSTMIDLQAGLSYTFGFKSDN